jgi:hypothetical protein
VLPSVFWPTTLEYLQWINLQLSGCVAPATPEYFRTEQKTIFKNYTSDTSVTYLSMMGKKTTFLRNIFSMLQYYGI